MENNRISLYDGHNFECYTIDKIGVIKIKNNVFDILTDLKINHRLKKCMTLLEMDDAISAIVIINDKNSLGNEEYANYINKVTSHKKNEKRFDETRILNNETRMREHVILNNIISKIVKSGKIIVNASNGEIVTPFFGAALAADIRFATEDTIYLLSHLQMDIHPTGALPYFLPKYLGHAKASQILLCSDKITAEEALELGIIFEILPSENYEEISLAKVRKIISRGNNALKCTIKMLSSNFENLREYTNMEECEYSRR